MYDKLKLPKDKVLRETLLSCLDFDTSELIKRNKFIGDNIDEKIYANLPYELKKQVLTNIFENISFSEGEKLNFQLHSQIAFESFLNSTNAAVDKYTTLQRKKLKKKINNAEFLQDPLVCYDTTKYDNQLKATGADNITHRIAIVYLACMMKSGQLDGQYEFMRLQIKERRNVACIIEQFLKYQGPEPANFQKEKQRLVATYERDMPNFKNLKNYQPLAVGLFDPTAVLIHLSIYEPKKRYRLIKQYYQFYYKENAVQAMTDRIDENLRRINCWDKFGPALMLFTGWSDFRNLRPHNYIPYGGDSIIYLLYEILVIYTDSEDPTIYSLLIITMTKQFLRELSNDSIYGKHLHYIVRRIFEFFGDRSSKIIDNDVLKCLRLCAPQFFGDQLQYLYYNSQKKFSDAMALFTCQEEAELYKTSLIQIGILPNDINIYDKSSEEYNDEGDNDSFITALSPLSDMSI